MLCKFCGRLCKNDNSLRNHQRLCKLNEDRQYTKFSDIEFQKNKGNIPSNQFIKAKLLGLPDIIVSDETRLKLSIANKNRTKEFNKAMGIKVSATINAKVAKGEWHTSLAKNMHHNYNGVDLHGSWELKYAKYMDASDIRWIRCKENFKYSFEGTERRYTPDFYLIETEEYIEIKGYKTKKDIAKWESFPKDKILKILTYKELKLLGLDIK